MAIPVILVVDDEALLRMLAADHFVGVEVGHGLEPGLAGRPYVRPLLLSRVESPFMDGPPLTGLHC